ncbi:hypothetical protein RB597_008045 [Gaeumannomyces tritici]
MSSSVPLQVAETVQTAHINRHPSASHDLNPSTAADKLEPVTLHEKPDGGGDVDSLDDEAEDVRGDDDDEEEEEEEDIPYDVLRPLPRRQAHQMPPLPDLRFEQSYLRSIAKADTWWKVAWITARDQVMMPLAQGVLYNLAIGGWQYWNKNAQLHGSSSGAKLRRWWYGVNNWIIPPEKSRTTAVRPSYARQWSDFREEACAYWVHVKDEFTRVVAKTIHR